MVFNNTILSSFFFLTEDVKKQQKNVAACSRCRYTFSSAIAVDRRTALLLRRKEIWSERNCCFSLCPTFQHIRTPFHETFYFACVDIVVWNLVVFLFTFFLQHIQLFFIAILSAFDFECCCKNMLQLYWIKSVTLNSYLTSESFFFLVQH